VQAAIQVPSKEIQISLEPPVDAHEFAAVLLLRSANLALENALVSVSLKKQRS
jgi:hypothetical protein